MEKVILYISKYAFPLFTQILLLGGFIYFKSTKTESEVSRRWRASGLFSTLIGFLIHHFFLAIIGISYFFRASTESLSIALQGLFIEIITATISLATFITMPTIIIGTFLAYYNFWRTGDRLIEKYWRNPKIHYGENEKPPFLKF